MNRSVKKIICERVEICKRCGEKYITMMSKENCDKIYDSKNCFAKYIKNKGENK